ncbi:hypothetical protein PtrSN002B_010210 [Pyrenophora tritici-repentis]|uniref:Uncharacterized protein n=2 Tax=Pyrenophora tritici-repentis TaxID=45151 RepID=A0A2W1GE09_9PLEO|nr:uncharacterized protein PTRG_02622 [Pyrenophora tritici-repentis Pt-1C-BFP]KAA8623316.1 hypothetical protein PtrV1_04622 [Pyrenophora tritici-repentis]EDU45145.1 predicted protein [Pyrenophora tritici-repentis Pt-1C-BFP]KAF7452314.1 hypothetical protein A1F99_040920 [Pyrenophora tritici-repentis]KAF7574562.1 hypothetical protein PtrM4_061850 [Pyrenophora tritici-repentis]KAG9386654.1 hypothetical protein A1F94_003404 [Pyrenophora tritici-repentis]
MPPIRAYHGAFSFTTSQLQENSKRVFPDYDAKDLKTWPFVTLAVVERYKEYNGVPDLPTGVAYERAVAKRYEEMYTAADRVEIASMNGSFYERYPFNYIENDNPKETVGMTMAEYCKYMEKAVAANKDELRYSEHKPSRKFGEETDQTSCTNSEYAREVARLQGELFDKGSQLVGAQDYLREHEATERLRRKAVKDKDYELRREVQRADAAVRECMVTTEQNIKLLRRIRDLEMSQRQSNDLGEYCRRLEVEVRDLRKRAAGKRGRDRRAESESDMGINGNNKKRRA